MSSSATDPFDAAQKEARTRLRARLTDSASQLRDAMASDDKPSLAQRTEALGFVRQAAQIFDLLPLVHVAWADGAIQAGERASILNLLKLRAIGPGEAWTVMETLLEERPSNAYLEASLDLLRDVLAERQDDGRTVVGLCILVAESAGGFLGLRTISSAERQMIEKIAERLGTKAQAEFQARLG